VPRTSAFRLLYLFNSLVGISVISLSPTERPGHPEENRPSHARNPVTEYPGADTGVHHRRKDVQQNKRY